MSTGGLYSHPVVQYVGGGYLNSAEYGKNQKIPLGSLVAKNQTMWGGGGQHDGSHWSWTDSEVALFTV
jgi:hypothetical protein